MVQQEPSSADLILWQRFVKAEQAYIAARMELCANASSLVELVRAGLRNPAERTAALSVAALLPVEKLQELLDELLALASFGHGLTGEARRVILSLPRDWLLENIQARAEPFLRLDEHEEYRRMLELFSLIDRDLALRLAQRAAEHADPDIREAGEDFMANPTPVLALEQ